ALDQLMKEHGGFEHNRQSLRVVELLEQKYPRFPGLNLTWEVREGLEKHFTCYDNPRGSDEIPSKSPSPSLEAQVANLADEITYSSHDLDDGLTARLFTEEQLRRDVKIWNEAAQSVQIEYGDLPDECRRYFIIRCIIDCQVKDVVYTTEENIRREKITTSDDARAHPKHLVRYSAERQKTNTELRDYLYANLYYNPEVHEPNRRAVRMLEDLFKYYMAHPDQIGEISRKRAAKEGM